MKRREFIAGFGLAAVWPLASRARQPAKHRTIGYLGANSAAAQSSWTSAFVERLREVGWIEGRNITIGYRWADGQYNRLPELANDLVKRQVAVIAAAGTPANVAVTA